MNPFYIVVVIIVWCGIMAIYWAGQPSNPFDNYGVDYRSETTENGVTIVPKSSMPKGSLGGVGIGGGMVAY